MLWASLWAGISALLRTPNLLIQRSGVACAVDGRKQSRCRGLAGLEDDLSLAILVVYAGAFDSLDAIQSSNNLGATLATLHAGD